MPIWADYGQLRQVFVNVIMNAFEAMERGMTLTIRSTFLDEEKIVKVEFVDTGVGISPEDLSQIFDPFFTTKQKGTGLGLSVVYGIVNRHGGRIDIQSREGEGTTVTIFLPVGREPDQTTAS